MHPFADLSAYLDGALAPAEHGAVQAHLGGCAECRSRLAELGEASRLVAALPVPEPRHSLVPRVSVPFWLAPLRTASAFGSGATLLLFLGSVFVGSFGARTTSAPAAPALDRASAPAAAPAPASGAVGPAGFPSEPARGVAGSPGFGAFASASPSASPDQAFAPSATPAAEQRAVQSDAAKTVNATGAPARRPEEVATNSDAFALETREREAMPAPWALLVVAALLGAIAIFAQRRLRRT